MNKIYKVVWSKVKHCYVVTSELAKSQTKGCGARSLRMATVSLGVAASLLCSGAVLPIFGESVAEAGQVTNVDDARVVADNAENSIVYGNNTGNIKEEKDDAVSLDGNTISINITKTLHRVYGGYSSVISAYTVSGNTVNIEKGTIQTDSGDAVNGGYSTNGGKITGNTVNVSVGSITGRVVGGCSMYGNVSGNAVNISGETTTINGDIYGGDRAIGNQGSDVDSTTNNTVVISGGNVNGDVYGGTSSYYGGDITINKVYIEGGTITGTVTGGKTLGQGNITENEVHVTGGNVTKDVQGGLSSSSSVNEVYKNSVSISKNATVGGSVYGGKVGNNQKGNVTKNSVTMSGGTVGGFVFGGHSEQTSGAGTVSDNTVEITGGTISGIGHLAGGYVGYYSDDANKFYVKDNIVKVSNDVDIRCSIMGGRAQGDAIVQNNRVEFSANNVDHSISIIGGSAGPGGAFDNKVIFSKGTVKDVTGGSSNGSTATLKGDVSGNNVEISGGTVYKGVVGGDSSFGNADNNIVTISGGTVNSSDYLGAVVGGCSGGGTAQTENGNQVIINGTANVKGDVSGGADGYYTAIASENTVTVDGSAVVTGKVMGASGKSRDKTKNKVYINKGSVTGDVFGACLDDSNNSFKSDDPNSVWYDGGNANSNEVHISDGTVTGNVYGGSIKDNVTGEVKENKVEIIGGTVTGKVHGGYSRDGNATDNTVTINGGNIVNKNGVDITGGTASEMDNNAKKNKVIISNGTIGSDEGSESDSYSKVVGGYGDGCNATDNTVTIAGGKFTGQIVFKLYGGESYTAPSTGTAGETFAATSAANDNTLDISGGTYSKDVEVYGGWTMAQPLALSGTAIATVTADNNKVSISGGTYSGNADVYGGYVFATPAAYGTESTATAKGTANNNTVEISGGTFSGNVSVYGGIGHVDTRGSGTVSGSVTADKNKVIISGGTINGYIAGGWATASASDNTVTIKDNAEIGKDARIYGGTASKLSSYTVTLGTAANNTVNVEKAITVAALIGGFGDETNSTGNTLNIGATGVQSESVSDFQTIALTEAVAWDNGKTVLSAKNFDYDDSIKAALDISAATNLASATSGQMTLLASQTDNDLNALSLTYADGTATLNSTTTSVKIKDAASSDDDGSGVIVNAQSTHTVSLDADNNFKNVIYKVESDNVTGVTFNPEKQIAFSMTEVARDLTGKTFGATNTVDVENLKFADSSEAIAKGASMSLVANATGITTTIDHNTSKTIAIDYEDAQKIKYSATASGDVASDGTAVKFTVDSVILDRMDLTGWTGAPSDVQSETTGWTVNSETSINTGELANAGLAAMNPGDMKTILTADTAVDFSVASITGNKAWQAGGTITDTDTSGVSVAGSTTGGGVTFVNTNKNVLIYQKDKKTIDSITLGSMAFTKDGTVRSFDNTYDLTGAGISATGFSISNASTAIMNTGDEMVVVDATNAIGETKLQEFSKTEKPVAFSDTIEGTILTFAGSRADSLEQNAAKTQIVYKVGDKNVETATLDGTVAWGSAGYQNDNSKYKFSTATNIDATKLKVTGETTEGLTKGSGMTLLYASELASSNTVTQPTDPGTITVNYTNAEGIVFGGDAKGEVKAESGSVNYKVTSVTLTSVGLADWNGTESSMTTSGIGDWTVTDSSQVKVTAGDMANAGLDAMNPGEIKKVLTAVDSVDFSKADISGSKAWKDGGAFDEGTHESGVSVKGSTTGGGVKADDTSKNVLVYQKDKSTVTDITLGAVKYDTSKPARTFDNSYDLTKVVEVAASDFSLSNLDDVKASMNAGDKMVVIDATGAVGNTAIQNFATQNAGAAIEFTDAIEGKALTLSGTHQDTLEAKDATIIYKVGDKSVTKATFTGEVAWNDSEAYYTNDASKYKFNGATDIDVTALKVTGTSTKALKNGDAMMLLSAEGMTAGTVTPQSDANKTASKITVSYSDATSGIGFGAEATGAVSATANAVKYEVNEVTLKTVDLGGWNGTTAVVTEGWSAPVNSVAVNNADAITVVPTTTQAIVTAGSSMFADVNVEKVVDFDPVAQNGVTLTGTQTNTIKTTQTNVANDTITYEVGKKDVKTVDIGTVEWGGEALDGSSADYNYAGAAFGTDNFVISNPDQVEVDTSMTLLKANETLAAMAEETKKASFVYSPVSGVRIDGDITGTMSRSGNNIMFAATENKASQLTFTNVEWKDTLMTRPANIVFDGAKVVTTDIKFTNIDSQVADQTMTLVKNFDGTPSAIEGDHYMVGSGRMGEGAAEMSGNDLIFRAKTGTAPTEATHETVMAMEAGTAVVAAGREYVDSAVEGLGLVSNMAPDGTSTFASMGGGVGRYKTGSHVDTHTWSAVVAVGSKREHKKGNLEWGVFAEYGRGNYTLHDDNGGRGDGDTNYAGGGLLAKWTNKHDVYTEASVRMGRMSDSASNMLMDRLGNSYGYDIHANYFGAHVGLGKIIKVKKNRDLDVYGKYFYLRRNGVDFDAGGNHYTLDSVTSSLLRIGARYGSNDKKWNWYGGLAYEYEFGGESKGTVDGLAIRSASIKGGSVRGEIGMRMEATKTNPWKVDIGIYGYGGKHRGFGGNVSVAYMF